MELAILMPSHIREQLGFPQYILAVKSGDHITANGGLRRLLHGKRDGCLLGRGSQAVFFAEYNSAPPYHPTLLTSLTARTSTAVTLYSGQLVAQSELSVVMMFVCICGKWKVV